MQQDPIPCEGGSVHKWRGDGRCHEWPDRLRSFLYASAAVARQPQLHRG